MTLHELLEQYAGGRRWYARGMNDSGAVCVRTKREATEVVRGMYPNWTPGDDGREEQSGAGIEPLAEQIAFTATGCRPVNLRSVLYLAEDDWCVGITVQNCIILAGILKRLATA